MENSNLKQKLEYDEKEDIYIVSKYLPQEISYKGKTSNLSGEA